MARHVAAVLVLAAALLAALGAAAQSGPTELREYWQNTRMDDMFSHFVALRVCQTRAPNASLPFNVYDEMLRFSGYADWMIMTPSTYIRDLQACGYPNCWSGKTYLKYPTCICGEQTSSQSRWSMSYADVPDRANITLGVLKASDFGYGTHNVSINTEPIFDRSLKPNYIGDLTYGVARAWAIVDGSLAANDAPNTYSIVYCQRGSHYTSPVILNIVVEGPVQVYVAFNRVPTAKDYDFRGAYGISLALKTADLGTYNILVAPRNGAAAAAAYRVYGYEDFPPSSGDQHADAPLTVAAAK